MMLINRKRLNYEFSVLILIDITFKCSWYICLIFQEPILIIVFYLNSNKLRKYVLKDLIKYIPIFEFKSNFLPSQKIILIKKNYSKLKDEET